MGKTTDKGRDDQIVSYLSQIAQQEIFCGALATFKST